MLHTLNGIFLKLENPNLAVFVSINSRKKNAKRLKKNMAHTKCDSGLELGGTDINGINIQPRPFDLGDRTDAH